MAGVNSFTLIKPMIGISKVKYDVLDREFSRIRIDQKSVVFYMDLYTIICRCYRNDFADKLSRADSTINMIDFVIGIMNTIAHYRFYTVHRLKKKSYIVLTCDRRITEYQKKLCPDFRWDRVDRIDPDGPFHDMNKIIYKAYRFVQSICTYLEGIYVIDYDTGIDSITTAALLRNTDKFKDCFHVLFTKSMMATQLISNDTVMLYHKRDDTKLLTVDNFLSDGLMTKIQKKTKDRFRKQLSPSMVPYICMIGGCIHVLKNVKGIGGIVSGAKIVSAMLEQGYITRNVSLQTFLDQFEKYKYKLLKGEDLDDEAEYFNKEQYNNFINRYRAFSIPLNLKAASRSQILSVYKRIVDLYDQNYLDGIVDMLSNLNDPDRLLDLDKLNATVPEEEDYNGEWW